jgi:hypothetical protein
MVGTTQTDAQMRILLMSDALGMYVLRVIVRSVTIAMARIEKSAA